MVMEYISGNSLHDVMRSVNVKSIRLNVKISILAKVAVIVDECHKLAENVLHRDIKPSNIMLCDFDYMTNECGRVVVLDFDMSWHKGSREKDIIFESRDDFGYLAPEQTDKKSRYTSRSTKVDSYGFGMTVFALITNRQPVPNIGLSDGWFTDVRNSFETFKSKQWQCITYRLARLVLDCTIIDQADRLDFSSVRRQIEAVDEILNGSQDNVPLELIGEESLWLLSCGKDYVWDDVQDSGELKRVDGRSVTVRALEYARSLEIAIYFVSKGGQNYRSVNLNVSAANDTIKSMMEDKRIQVYDHTSGPGQFVAHIRLLSDSLSEFSGYEKPKYVADIIRPVFDQLTK
jgi:eukaryotic-like serine/threonine-protein kinase